MSSSDDQTATRRVVTVGHEDQRESDRRPSGLQPGERVVVDGAARLTEGASVSIAPPPRRHGPGANGQRRRKRRAAAREAASLAAARHGPTVNISAPFIARPIATWLLAIAVLLAGVLGYRALPVSALPQVDFPTIQVTTQLPGASPDTVATLITASLERQFGQIPG